ncbi:MAG: beta-ketoacyl synthase chain length factor [Treponema sp.]|nr:beta-ketoacyl synthase chain length factor [Treponema sp.]MBD5409770.1 beta-ketoacyl synthase chain length factor [Treponema sp.]MBD5412453.1 beta-ketoacyl synthase chain length factor [Treponema sp.]
MKDIKDVLVSHIHTFIPEGTEAPKLEFVDPLFRRRLSQITKMTIHVLHDLLEEIPEATDYKQVFISFRGEIKREFTINKGLIEDSEILPAAFSLSVFNTPIAAASIALKLKAGYSVLYPSKGNFLDALKAASAPLLCGAEEKIILVYADEYIPDEYGVPQNDNTKAKAIACILDLYTGEPLYERIQKGNL